VPFSCDLTASWRAIIGVLVACKIGGVRGGLVDRNVTVANRNQSRPRERIFCLFPAT